MTDGDGDDETPNYGYLGPSKNDDDDDDDTNDARLSATYGSGVVGHQITIKGGKLTVADDDDDKDVDEEAVIRELESDSDPSHLCRACEVEQDVESERMHAPNWCRVCEQVRTFVRLDSPSLTGEDGE